MEQESIKMSEDIYSQYLRISITESANSTFTEGDAILTGASVQRLKDQNIGIEIHAIGCHPSWPEDLPSTGAREQVTFCLSTRSGLTVMPNFDAEHVIYIHQVGLEAGVGTYLPLVLDRESYMPAYVEFKHPLLLSHPKIYAYIQSTNSSATATCRAYILFTYVLLDADLAIEALESFR